MVKFSPYLCKNFEIVQNLLRLTKSFSTGKKTAAVVTLETASVTKAVTKLTNTRVTSLGTRSNVRSCSPISTDNLDLSAASAMAYPPPNSSTMPHGSLLCTTPHDRQPSCSSDSVTAWKITSELLKDDPSAARHCGDEQH